MKIGNDIVCEMMKEEGLSKDDPRKRVKKKPWIRYERKHPLSAVHIDWHKNKMKEQVCSITDDSSRMILAIGEFNAISSDSSIKLLGIVMETYSYIRSIGLIICDHGSEFYATRRDKYGNADHRFEKFCEMNDNAELRIA